jgi:hypothetical protein
MVQQLATWTREVLLLTTPVTVPQSRHKASSHKVTVLASNVRQVGRSIAHGSTTSSPDAAGHDARIARFCPAVGLRFMSGPLCGSSRSSLLSWRSSLSETALVVVTGATGSTAQIAAAQRGADQNLQQRADLTLIN